MSRDMKHGLFIFVFSLSTFLAFPLVVTAQYAAPSAWTPATAEPAAPFILVDS